MRKRKEKEGLNGKEGRERKCGGGKSKGEEKLDGRGRRGGGRERRRERVKEEAWRRVSRGGRNHE